MKKGQMDRILQSSLALLALCAILTCPATAITTITDDISLPQQPYVQGEIFVKYPVAANGIAVLPGINTHAPAEILRDYGSLVPGLMLVKVPDGVTVEDAVAYYHSLPGVEYVHPNYYVSPYAIPNDPDYSSYQWGLKNPSSQGGISAPEAWDIAVGNDSVIVAVLDTGVDIEHPDLAANIWTNPGEIPNDGLDNDGNGYVDDYHGWNVNSDTPDVMDYNGHGTHCAGIIGAVTNNSQGIAGVAWNVSIMPVSVFDCNLHRSADGVIRGIQYAVVNHADILSMSFGNPTYCQAEKDVIDAAGAKGILCVCSAGNDGTNNDADSPKYPASYDSPNILAVAASDENNTLTDFSNYGPISVDIAAPGNEIYSTYPILSGVPLNITSFTTMGVLGDTWEYGVFEGQNYTSISGNASSLIYYMEPVSVSGHTFTIGDTVAYNLSSDSYLAYVFSNKNYSQYGSLAEFENDEDNVFYLYFYLDSDTNGVFYTSSDTRLRSLIEYILGPGPYYIGMYYTSTVDSDYANLTSLVFVNNDRVTGHTYENMSGTSMSAPMVAGAAAVMKAVNPSLTSEQIIQIINDTADTCPALTGKVRSGGRLNFSAALMKARPEFEVAFNSTGGTDVPAQPVFYGSNVTRPSPDPTRDGYVFEGWYNDSTLSTPWNFATDKIYLDTVIYANWTLNTSSTAADVNGTATFGGGNLSALHSTAGNAVSSLLLEDVSNLSAGSAAIFTADNTSVPEIPSINGRTTRELAVFDLTATVNASAGEARFNLTLTFSDDETRQKSMDDIRIWHYNASLANWDDTSLDYAKSWNGSEVTYTVYTTSFSPFGVGLYPIISAPAPASSGGSSSRHQGGSILLQPGEVAPNSYATTAPTVAPTAKPTAAQVYDTPTTAPTAQPTQSQKSPAPVVGLIAGLGVATLVLARMRK